MRFNSLHEWLSWQESLNPKEIDLGLERVSRVLHQAGHNSHFDCPLIIVAGTNGKGSVVAYLEAIALAGGVKTCSYTSPHLLRYNERIRIDGSEIDDQSLCAAFERIDQARGDEQLTYFEFGTLAAIDLFMAAKPDLVVMEIGLGGRLDARCEVSYRNAPRSAPFQRPSIIDDVVAKHLSDDADQRGLQGFGAR